MAIRLREDYATHVNTKIWRNVCVPIDTQFPCFKNALDTVFEQYGTAFTEALGGVRSDWFIEELADDQIPLSNLLAWRSLGKEYKVSPEEKVLKILSEAVSNVKLLSENIFKIREFSSEDFVSRLNNTDRRSELRAAFNWANAPTVVKFMLEGFPAIFIDLAFNVGPATEGLTYSKFVVVHRANLEKFDKIVEKIGAELAGTPTIYSYNSEGSISKNISPVAWEDLFFEDQILKHLKDDFQSFFERYDWFKSRRLPFKRGYLLHGPPGNGKTSVVKAMATDKKLDVYTLQLLDAEVGETHLINLYDRAHENAPSIVVFEDLDRSFPKTGEGAHTSKIGLSSLLNAIDGIGVSEGVITIATANEPTILDTAILKRPGRFDRVLFFDNPNETLRQRYFQKSTEGEYLDNQMKSLVKETEDYSFAQLQETVILAGQTAYKDNSPISIDLLIDAAKQLRSSLAEVSHHYTKPGFGK